MKRTPWFDGSVLPVRVGAYEVQSDGTSGIYFSAFQGGKFHGCWGTADDAIIALGYSGEGWWSTVKSWRGLTKEAK